MIVMYKANSLSLFYHSGPSLGALNVTQVKWYAGSDMFLRIGEHHEWTGMAAGTETGVDPSKKGKRIVDFPTFPLPALLGKVG